MRRVGGGSYIVNGGVSLRGAISADMPPYPLPRLLPGGVPVEYIGLCPKSGGVYPLCRSQNRALRIIRFSARVSRFDGGASGGIPKSASPSASNVLNSICAPLVW